MPGRTAPPPGSDPRRSSGCLPLGRRSLRCLPARTALRQAPGAGPEDPSREAAPSAAAPRRPATPGGIDTDAIRRSWPDVLAKIFSIKRVTWTFLSSTRRSWTTTAGGCCWASRRLGWPTPSARASTPSWSPGAHRGARRRRRRRGHPDARGGGGPAPGGLPRRPHGTVAGAEPPGPPGPVSGRPLVTTARVCGSWLRRPRPPTTSVPSPTTTGAPRRRRRRSGPPRPPAAPAVTRRRTGPCRPGPRRPVAARGRAAGPAAPRPPPPPRRTPQRRRPARHSRSRQPGRRPAPIADREPDGAREAGRRA